MKSEASAGRFSLRRTVLGISLLILFTEIHPLPTQAQSPEVHWEHAYPFPTGSWLNAVVWGSKGFVAAGNNGELLFSEDGQLWQRECNSGTKNAWISAMCYYGGRYLAVGSQNLVLVSSNGQDWVAVEPGTNMLLRACAGGDGKYVAVGFNQTLLVSTNALNWQQRATPADFTDIVYGNDTWLALTGGSDVYISSDLKNWTNTTIGDFGPPQLTSVCFAQGRFVAGGATQRDEADGVCYNTVIMSSSNGLDWVSASLNGLDAFGETKDFVFADGQFVALQRDYFLRSTNGVEWEKIEAPNTCGTMAGLAGSGSGSFVAVGSQGAILTSSNAQAWQVISAGTKDEIHSITYANGQFIAAAGSPHYIGGPAGSAALLTSTNGYSWQVSLTNLENQLFGVAYGKGLWVVCGDAGGIYTSTNTVDWVDHSLPPTSYELHDMVYGNGRFVAFAASRDLIFHSTNGVDWVSADTPLISQVSKARFVNGHFIGVGGVNDGFIFTSSDGLAWNKRSLVGSGWLEGVTYGKGRYVAVGRDVSAVSFDATNWIVNPVPIVVNDLEYVKGWFVGVGPEEMIVSRDGLQWAKVDDPAVNDSLNALTYGGGILVAGGGVSLYRGTLNNSVDFDKHLRLLAPAQLEFYGVEGCEYRLEQSMNLMDWSPASTWVGGSNDYLIWDTASSQSAVEFWRVAGRTQ